jgi:hypothetical protein
MKFSNHIKVEGLEAYGVSSIAALKLNAKCLHTSCMFRFFVQFFLHCIL